MRYELSDDEWTAIKPMLPNKPRGLPVRVMPKFRRSSAAVATSREGHHQPSHNDPVYAALAMV
jgi:hypothetical protein